MKGKSEKFNSITGIIKFITGILSWVVLVLLVIVAAFLLYYFVSIKVYAKKGEEYRPPISLYTILTTSMVPNINKDDVIIDIKVDSPEDIKIGDVITFVSSATLTQGMTITHRVIDIKQENGEYLFYTKGDANLPADAAPAQFKNILGKVLFRIPKLGLLQHFLATKGGWLIVVVIPALWIIISDILKIFRLQSAKNQVESTLFKEEEKNQRDDALKHEVSQRLAERYIAKRRDNETDPIPKKNYIHISNGLQNNNVKKTKITKIDLPMRIDLPKLKKSVDVVNTSIVEENNAIKKKSNRSGTRKSKSKSKGLNKWFNEEDIAHIIIFIFCCIKLAIFEFIAFCE